MIVKWSPTAEAQLDDQITYIIEQGAPDAARVLYGRVNTFVKDTLAVFPRNGHHLTEPDLWETWIPRTRFVLWYRFDAASLEIVALFHTAQDRRGGH